MWIESSKPLRVRFKQGEVRLEPGHPVELPEEAGQRVLEKAGSKVRIVGAPDGSTIIEPASTTARSVYWEDVRGQLQGPAVPEFLGKTGAGAREQFWILVTYQGAVRWIRSDRLRAAPGLGSAATDMTGTGEKDGTRAPI